MHQVTFPIIYDPLAAGDALHMIFQAIEVI